MAQHPQPRPPGVQPLSVAAYGAAVIHTPWTVTALVMDGPTLTFLVLALVFLVVGAALAGVGALLARRKPAGRVVSAVVVLREGGYGSDFPDRRPDFVWTDEAGHDHRAHSASTVVPGLWVDDRVSVRLDPRDESRAHLVTDAPPRRELLLLGIACVLVGLLLGIVGLNEWSGLQARGSAAAAGVVPAHDHYRPVDSASVETRGTMQG